MSTFNPDMQRELDRSTFAQQPYDLHWFMRDDADDEGDEEEEDVFLVILK